MDRSAPPGTPVEVRVGFLPESGEAVAEVADEGPGLHPADAERIFERFYRADPARSRTYKGGTGLGLSIAAALVQAHGGAISVDSIPGHGATFRVRLPVS